MCDMALDMHRRAGAQEPSQVQIKPQVLIDKRTEQEAAIGSEFEYHILRLKLMAVQ